MDDAITGMRRAWLLAAAVSAALVAGTFPAAAQTEAQELTVAGPTALVDLDPHGPNAVEDPTTGAANHIYDPVVVLRDGDYQPWIATAWTNPDELTWEITIRPDVTFSDGSALTASDVKASIERVVNLEGPLAPLWSALDTIEAGDDATLVIRTTEPVGGMLTNLSLLYVTPEGASDEPDFFLEPVGSGPFKVESFQPGEGLTLVRNDAYWGEPTALDRLIIREIPEVSSRVTALATGEIDFTWGLPVDQMAVVEGESGITLETAPSNAFYMHFFNSSREPFDDVRVRQAMWHALDLQGIADALFTGVGTVAQAPIQPPVFGFAAQEAYTYDPELARQLLTEAGYPEGFSTSMQWAANSAPQIRELAQAMISQWAEVGITVEGQEKEIGQWVEDLLALNWDNNVNFNVTLTGDANFTIGRLYTCAANRNGYCSEELDGIIAEARATLDDEARAALWAEAARHIWDNAVGISIVDVDQNYAYRDGVEGFVPNPTGNPVFTGVSIAD